MDKRTEQRIKVLTKEQIVLVPYDAEWPARYSAVETEIKSILPRMLMQRIAHIGSTAVPGLSAKPIIDVQVEVSDLEAVKRDVVPRLEELGYEFIWRPTMGDDAPFYAWFIKRDDHGERNVHVHMVESGQASVDRIIFRDYLREHPEDVIRYEAHKQELAKRFPKDREAYTKHKTEYVNEVLAKARKEKMKR
ncbi:MAG: GrpB family protein [Flavobacteriales bacterium]